MQKKSEGWRAHLQLDYEYREHASVLAKRQHHGPLLVQRPFYPEGGVCHTYIIHPPGGVVGGDILQVDVNVNAGAHALLTTPASGKFYNSLEKCAQMRQNLHVGEGAVLEWLPQDNIFFEGSRSALSTHIELAQEARFIGWEISCLGRPFSDAPFDTGSCEQRLLISRNGTPLLIDHTRLQGGHEVLKSRWGLSAYTVSGTLLATAVEKPLLEELRSQFEQNEAFVFSATLMDDVLLCRFLGHHGETARQTFERAWRLIRPHVSGLDACPPRIWKT